jgi:NAD(P)-dependent dehydrogenase (short-subunit alcohol dehydrogenase family)
MVDTNLTGTWHTAKAAAPYLVEGGEGGSMVFVSSVAGLKGIRNIAHYVAAKHGMVGLMRSHALELAPQRVRVNTVHPTNVDTEMLWNPTAMHLFVPGAEDPTREQVAGVLGSLNALPVPWVEPDDVSNAVLFLASDEARCITGCMLTVDAGFMVK